MFTDLFVGLFERAQSALVRFQVARLSCSSAAGFEPVTYWRTSRSTAELRRK